MCKNALRINTCPTIIAVPTPKESGNRPTNVSLRRHSSRLATRPNNAATRTSLNSRMAVIQLCILRRSNFTCQPANQTPVLYGYSLPRSWNSRPLYSLVCEVRALMPYMGSHEDYVTGPAVRDAYLQCRCFVLLLVGGVANTSADV